MRKVIVKTHNHRQYEGTVDNSIVESLVRVWKVWYEARKFCSQTLKQGDLS